MILLAFVFLATACSQNTTTPTTPPANTTVYSIDSTYYFKINFNGKQLQYYAVKENALGVYLNWPGILVGTRMSLANTAWTNMYLQNANLTFDLYVNRVGDTVNSPIGAYDFHTPAGSIAGSGGITDLNTAKGYAMDSASTILNVTSIGVTSVTGVVSGKLNDGITLIPFTGSFCLRKT